MRRLFILGTIFVGLLVAFGLAGQDGFQTARRAEATSTTTTWTYPASGDSPNYIQAAANTATTGTVGIVPTVAAPCTNCYITRIVPDLVFMGDDASHPDG